MQKVDSNKYKMVKKTVVRVFLRSPSSNVILDAVNVVGQATVSSLG